eukprot:TRINITY_DN4423_c0_g1_i1.p1 TRINITY_DN4423_c0_g1~~TRINITY_DN4423_c0_g1_i1.p1  ORF type:complete len:289 (+),score=78.07 TRINITY_DN4423_c0_g1_i1:291-1157(+)
MMQLMRDQARQGKPVSDEKRIAHYIVKDKILAEGTTGTVKLAYNTYTEGYTAVKIVNKTVSRKRKEAKKEIKFLSKIFHENVVRLEHVEEDNTNIYIFTEYCELGDVFSYMQKHGIFDEDTARKLFGQMLDAVEFCHRKLHICHHDIKLENCVLDVDFTLKLIDFGFAIDMEDDPAGKKLIKIYDGSPAYSPLEILMRRPHDETVDIYSLGTALFYMICGTFPFCDPSKTTFDELCKNVQANQVEFPKNVSTAAQDLITKMLAPKNDRLSIEEIRSHPWMNLYDPMNL